MLTQFNRRNEIRRGGVVMAEVMGDYNYIKGLTFLSFSYVYVTVETLIQGNILLGQNPRPNSQSHSYDGNDGP